MNKDSRINSLHIIIVGDDNIGKRSYTIRITEGEFKTYIPICRAEGDFYSTEIYLGDERITTQIWGGPVLLHPLRRFKALLSIFVKKMQGIVFQYDIGNIHSFKNLNNWIELFSENKSKDLAKNYYLIGNKCDLKRGRAVSWEEGYELAAKYGMLFFETSAKSNMNVSESFQFIIKHIYDGIINPPNIQDYQ